MESTRKIAITVGVLFIIATGAPILSIPFLQHMNVPDYLSNVSANVPEVTTGALLELIMALAIAGIAIMLYPILNKYNETLAIGYLGARVTEGIIFIVAAVIGLLTLVTLSREFVSAGAPESSYFQTLGKLLVNAHDWSYVLAGKIIFTLSALMLNYILYRTKLVPRFLAIWGLLGAALLLVGGVLNMFGSLSDTSVPGTLIFLPIALQEMVFAVWLIAKGFNLSASTSGTVREI